MRSLGVKVDGGQRLMRSEITVGLEIKILWRQMKEKKELFYVTSTIYTPSNVKKKKKKETHDTKGSHFVRDEKKKVEKDMNNSNYMCKTSSTCS